MKILRLGATALEISEIGFGGIPIIPLPRDEAVSVVQHCLDLGITFFDTANMYTTSEEKLGIALKSDRGKVVIATKTAQRDAKGAAEHLDLSLRQLQTDWIDLYQLHNVSNADALEQVLAPAGAYEAVAKAVRVSAADLEDGVAFLRRSRRDAGARARSAGVAQRHSRLQVPGWVERAGLNTVPHGGLRPRGHDGEPSG